MIELIFYFIVFEFLFLIPSFFLYRRFLRNRSRLKNLNIYSVLATVLMPLLWTALFIGVCYGIINPILRSKDFNSNQWAEDVSIRYRMTNDLKANVLIGKNKTQVIELLGKSDGKCGYKASQNTICYLVPDPDNIGILDHIELVITFNEVGTIVSVTTEMI